MTRLLTTSQVRAWLQQNGIGAAQAQKVEKGIDASKPVYLETLWPGEKIVQFRDLPSLHYPNGDLGGQWFALPAVGADSMGSLGIGSGLAGRTRRVLTVMRAVEVLESTAAPMPGHPTQRYIGPGGATQIFLPDRGLSSLA